MVAQSKLPTDGAPWGMTDQLRWRAVELASLLVPTPGGALGSAAAALNGNLCSHRPIFRPPLLSKALSRFLSDTENIGPERRALRGGCGLEFPQGAADCATGCALPHFIREGPSGHGHGGL
ncbi:hypothetical protein TRVL_03203 [Trypanosoma vivax]|nr:hypothetical protein TRVL_03203 [Trypanosoma vivax]